MVFLSHFIVLWKTLFLILTLLFWGAIAIFIQLAYAFIVTRVSGKYSFNEKINEGVVSVGILMAFLSICIGLLNARSMSY